MKIITREHNFENRFNFIKLAKKYCYMSSEKSNPIKVKITEKILNAFNNQDWETLEKIYISQY
jgi:hypothetical protein